MPWAKLTLPEPRVKEGSFTVITLYEAAYRAAGRPQEANLYREYALGGDRVFWFTPEAAALVPVALEQYGADTDAAPPDIATLKHIAV